MGNFFSIISDKDKKFLTTAKTCIENKGLLSRNGCITKDEFNDMCFDKTSKEYQNYQDMNSYLDKCDEEKKSFVNLEKGGGCFDYDHIKNHFDLKEGKTETDFFDSDDILKPFQQQESFTNKNNNSNKLVLYIFIIIFIYYYFNNLKKRK